jgi:lipopolysaccharide export LptBFGC system permease protein LptF
MNIFDRYIARQIFISSAYAVAVIIIILVLGNVFKEILRELAKRPDLDLWFVLKFIGLIIPISLSLALPFSFLTSILLVFGRLSADSEFVSMRMAGLSMARICFPVGVLALFFTGVCGYVNLSVTPAAKTEMEGMKDSLLNLVKREPMLIFPDKIPMTKLPGHVVYANKEDGVLKGFHMVKTKDYIPQFFAMAEFSEVAVELEQEDPELIMKMTNVNLLMASQDESFMDAAQPIFMTEATAGLSLKNLASGSKGVNDQPENISLFRLIEKVGDENQEPEDRADYKTELNMRCAFSLSCITFALLGVPLGLTAQRREGTAGFIISMILAVIYYMMLNSAESKSDDPEANAHILVWIPNVLFLTVGAILFWRMSRK